MFLTHASNLSLSPGHMTGNAPDLALPPPPVPPPQENLSPRRKGKQLLSHHVEQASKQQVYIILFITNAYKRISDYVIESKACELCIYLFELVDPCSSWQLNSVMYTQLLKAVL